MSTARRIYAGAACCLIALVGLLALVGRIDTGSAAPSTVEVLAIEPADEAILPDAPASILIRIAGRPDPERSHISVYDGSRALLSTGRVAADGTDGLRQRFTAVRPGQLSVAYHVVTVDGRDASGITRFTVGAPDAPPPPRAGASDTHVHRVDPVGAGLLALDGLVLVAVIVLLLRSRQRR